MTYDSCVIVKHNATTQLHVPDRICSARVVDRISRCKSPLSSGSIPSELGSNWQFENLECDPR